MKSFKDLIVWQKSIILVKEVYTLLQKLPTDERFGLISQMRRSAVSIPSNIAEGSKRGTSKDYLQFLRIANGSCAELETQLVITKELYGVTVGEVDELLIEVQKMLQSIIKTLSTET
ncbi:four helix bundle protein [Candidatus Kaiserbacteria bacterium]|nr:four helix bundle protein [Candidatus Kaiserbacteria bacterium]MCB9811719.1 four helix bundle protein [Candidatus Nomurabacteria bacterium]